MFRSVEQLYSSQRTLEGGGFPVRRPFPVAGLSHLDPFLLLDEMGPVTWKPGEAIGAPSHPHRGFETVTYLLAGEMEHRDSAGHTGTLSAGDVQWMTAGRGVVHSELPSDHTRRHGGLTHGFQVWVNLPRADKMMAPRYQEIPREVIPEVEAQGVKVRVIAGRALGAEAVIETRTAITYLHVTLAAGARFDEAIASEDNVYIYPFVGGIHVGTQAVREGQIAVLAHDGPRFQLENHDVKPAQCLVLGGKPLNEPVARYGPFVMNTEQEIMQAFADYRSGRFLNNL